MKNKYNIILFLFACVIVTCELRAQYTVSSPYSKYGIGLTDMTGNQYLSSMGGVSQGFRRSNVVNIMNPASYSAVDTQSFVLDVGMVMRWDNFSTNDNSSKSFLASITNFSLAFPICKSVKVALGLAPISDISYNASDTVLSVGQRGEDDYIPTYTKGFDGTGGLDKVILGLSYQPLFNDFLSRFAIGANVSYVFGNMYRNSMVSFAGAEGYVNARVERNYNVSAFDFDIGMQYFQPIGSRDCLGIGVTFTLPNKYGADEEYFRYTYLNDNSAASLLDTVQYNFKEIKIKMPYKIAGGISYERENKYFVGADLVYTKWSRFDFESDGQPALKDNLKIALGGEITPDMYGKYWEKMSYRLGANYDNGYIYLNGKRINKMGLSLGMSMPIKKIGTSVNLSFECGKMGTKDNSLISRTYYSIGLSITAKDKWFVKRKYK